MELNNKKTIWAWCMYDWANSVYSLVITTAIFPIYYESVTQGVDKSGIVSFFGWELPNTALYSYALSFSFLFTAAILPLLTGIADYSGKKKTFLKIFVYLGSVACISLALFTGDNVEFGIMGAVVASIGFSGSLVFYDAFLPEIASPDRFDRISAKGYSMGYIGSVILLIVNIAMLQKPGWFFLDGMDATWPARISFIMVGLWWAGFSQITFNVLPDNVYNRKESHNLFKDGYEEIKKVFFSLKNLPDLKKYLVAFFFYNAGVQAVMYLATLFASVELKMETGSLIGTVLIIQIVAIGGAYLFAKISEAKGNVSSLSIMLVIWVLVCVAAYFVNTQNQFYMVAFAVGLVMGGIQALSRATYAKLIPTDTIDHASYFSFYDVTYNVSIVMGTFAYGIVSHITGTMRNSVLALIAFFVLGLITLLMVKVPKVKISAKEEPLKGSE